MTMSGAEMAEMVAVLRDSGLDADDITAACARVAAAGLSHSVQATRRSPGAVRQARYRARQRAEQGVTKVTGSDASVTPGEGAEAPGNVAVLAEAPSPMASRDVTKRHQRYGRAKKESSPTPPKEKTTPSSQKGFRPQPSQLAVGAKVHILKTDPVFAEIETMRGKSMPDFDSGGWRFDVGEVEAAKARLVGRGNQRIPSRGGGLRGQGGEMEINQIEAAG